MEPCAEDLLLEEFAEIVRVENRKLPAHFDSLLTSNFNSSDRHTPTFSRYLSLEDSSLKKKNCQRADDEECEETFSLRTKKRVRSQTEDCTTISRQNSVLKFKSSEEIIKLAIQRSDSEPDLIADFSRCYSLPLTSSRHHDLKAIAAATLKQLLNDEFRERVASFTIIDCRYPYEFEGGHIPGAINVYTHDQCSDLLEKVNFNGKPDKPNVLIFHCEFSAERGPNLYRHMRQEDRKKNIQMYPSLCFPEMYILEGGYRQFFEQYSSMCSPPKYTQMLDPTHSNELLLFRKVSKTWDSDVKNCMRKRNIRKK